MTVETESLHFLPYLIHEEIYRISEQLAVGVQTIGNTLPEKVTTSAPILAEPKIEKVAVIEEPKAIAASSEPVETKPIQEQAPAIPIAPIVPHQKESVVESKVIEASTPKVEGKISKKIVVLVGYANGIPVEISTGYQKIFAALQLSDQELEIINVLDSPSKKLDQYSFSYLILMGGNGKNLEFLQNYNGQRSKYEIGTHQGAKIYFADAMDVYLKPENIELKKKYWAMLKQLLSSN